LNRRIRNGGVNYWVLLSFKIIDKNSISSFVDNSTCQKCQQNCQWNFVFIFLFCFYFYLKLLMKTLLAQLSSVNNNKIFFNDNSVVSFFFFCNFLVVNFFYLKKACLENNKLFSRKHAFFPL